MYEMVRKVLNNELSIEQAAMRYHISKKTVCRKIDAYLWEGLGGLSHKSRGRRAHNRTEDATAARVVELYKTRYAGYNFTHFHQKLKEEEHIGLSYPTVYAILMDACIVSPKAQGKHSEDRLHPLRKRRGAFGELVQMDASMHNWFSDVICHLHLAIDDATSHVLGGYFDSQETIKGYYQVLAQVASGYGVPEELYTDRRTVFTTPKTKDTRLENDAGTQFRLAAFTLGVIEIHTTSVPQAKGRIERAFQTFQDRLISEMRSAKVTSIDKANAFLPGFIADHNDRYALPYTGLECAFSAGPGDEKITMALSIVSERIVNSGSVVRVSGRYYAPYSKAHRIALKKGLKALVLHALDDKLYLLVGEDIYTLVDIQTNDLPTPEHLQAKISLPPRDHPFKEASYQMMLKRLRRAG